MNALTMMIIERWSGNSYPRGEVCRKVGSLRLGCASVDAHTSARGEVWSVIVCWSRKLCALASGPRLLCCRRLLPALLVLGSFSAAVAAAGCSGVRWVSDGCARVTGLSPAWAPDRSPCYRAPSCEPSAAWVSPSITWGRGGSVQSVTSQDGPARHGGRRAVRLTGAQPCAQTAGHGRAPPPWRRPPAKPQRQRLRLPQPGRLVPGRRAGR